MGIFSGRWLSVLVVFGCLGGVACKPTRSSSEVLGKADHASKSDGVAYYAARESEYVRFPNDARDLFNYIFQFGLGYFQRLASLPKDGHLIEFGSGSNVALEQPYNPEAGVGFNGEVRAFHLDTLVKSVVPNEQGAYRKAFLKLMAPQNVNRFRSTGVTLKTRRPLPKGALSDRVRIIQSPLSKIPLATLIQKPFGKADVEVDFLGVMSYTDALSEDLAKMLLALKEDGVLYVYVDSRSLNFHDSRITLLDGKTEVDIYTWLKQIDGINVDAPIVNTDMKFGTHGVFVITKTARKDGGPIRIPLLRCTSLEDRGLSPIPVRKFTTLEGPLPLEEILDRQKK